MPAYHVDDVHEYDSARNTSAVIADGGPDLSREYNFSSRRPPLWTEVPRRVQAVSYPASRF